MRLRHALLLGFESADHDVTRTLALLESRLAAIGPAPSAETRQAKSGAVLTGGPGDDPERRPPSKPAHEDNWPRPEKAR